MISPKPCVHLCKGVKLEVFYPFVVTDNLVYCGLSVHEAATVLKVKISLRVSDR